MTASGSAALHGSAGSEAAKTAVNDLAAVREAVRVGLEAGRALVVGAWARVLLMIELVAFVVHVRLASDGVLVSDGSWSRRPFHGCLLRGRFGSLRWRRRLFGCCCEGSGSRFRG